MKCEKHRIEGEVICPVCSERNTIAKSLNLACVQSFDAGFERKYKNFRTREEKKAWERGWYWGLKCDKSGK